MKWESGRTRQNLIHSVRETKAQRQTTKQVQAFVRGIAPAVVRLLVAAGMSIRRAGNSLVDWTIDMIVAIFVLVRFDRIPSGSSSVLVCSVLFGAVGWLMVYVIGMAG